VEGSIIVELALTAAKVTLIMPGK